MTVYVRGSEGNTVTFDDFRIKPLDAQMTSYVYNEEHQELTHLLDNNNTYTSFEYDAFGRLVKTSKESITFGTKKVSESAINYGNLE